MSDRVVAVAEDGTPVTQAMVDAWCDAYDGGRLPDGYEYDGGVRQGRPRMFEDGSSTVVVRVPAAQKAALGREARRLGLTMSGYVREIIAERKPVSA